MLDRHYTKEEYFELLRTSQHKYEYCDGRVKMMAGGTEAHNELVGNVYFALRSRAPNSQLKGSQFVVAVDNRYTFADASAVCGAEAVYAPHPADIACLTNPALIVEVLSESSDPYDRTEKFSAYRRLPSFREYLLIDSRRYSAETFYREQPDLWRIGNYFGLDQEVELRTLGISVPLSVFYEGVTI